MTYNRSGSGSNNSSGSSSSSSTSSTTSETAVPILAPLAMVVASTAHTAKAAITIRTITRTSTPITTTRCTMAMPPPTHSTGPAATASKVRASQIITTETAPVWVTMATVIITAGAITILTTVVGTPLTAIGRLRVVRTWVVGLTATAMVTVLGTSRTSSK